MDISLLIQRVEGVGGLAENIYGGADAGGRAELAGDAVEHFHDQSGIGGFAEKCFVDFEVDATPKLRVAHLAADFIFVDELIDEALIFFGFDDNLLEGINLGGNGIADGIDDAAGAFAEEVDYIVAVEAAG